MYNLVYDRISAELLLTEEAVPWFQTLVKLPEQIFNGPISDDRVLNAINAKSFEEKSNFVVVNNTIFNRMKGALPVLDLAGDKYFVDVPLQELRSTIQVGSRIPFIDFSNDPQGICGWYDKGTKTIVYFHDKELLHTPANAYFVQFPDWYKIDPIGTAIFNDNALPQTVSNNARYLNYVQMIVHPTATSTHISETYLASLIRDNRARKGLPPKRIMMPSQDKNKQQGL